MLHLTQIKGPAAHRARLLPNIFNNWAALITKALANKHKVVNFSNKLLALQKGKIIKRETSTKYPNWQWLSDIDPNIQMIREMNKQADEIYRQRTIDKKKENMPEIDFDELMKSSDNTVNITVKKRGGARPGAGRKTKAVEQSEVKESKEISILWGMFKLKTTK